VHHRKCCCFQAIGLLIIGQVLRNVNYRFILQFGNSFGIIPMLSARGADSITHVSQ
jgi:hypothetical protein